MKAAFVDYEDPNNPANGHLVTASKAVEVLRSLQDREPFVCSLQTDSGTLLVGVHREMGFVQFARAGAEPPYLIATTGAAEDSGGYIEFLSGGTPSPIPSHYCLPWALVEKAIEKFVNKGGMSEELRWEEV